MTIAGSEKSQPLPEKIRIMPVSGGNGTVHMIVVEIPGKEPAVIDGVTPPPPTPKK